jgi:hypothetical protein
MKGMKEVEGLEIRRMASPFFSRAATTSRSCSWKRCRNLMKSVPFSQVSAGEATFWDPQSYRFG